MSAAPAVRGQGRVQGRHWMHGQTVFNHGAENGPSVCVCVRECVRVHECVHVCVRV